MDRRRTGRAQRVEDPCRPRRDELLVVARRQCADPRVEQLHDVGPRARLRDRVGRERPAQLVEERRPDTGFAVHQRLRDDEVARGTSFHEVPRDGEGAAAEADDGLFAAKLAANEPDRVEHGTHTFLEGSRP